MSCVPLCEWMVKVLSHLISCVAIISMSKRQTLPLWIYTVKIQWKRAKYLNKLKTDSIFFYGKKKIIKKTKTELKWTRMTQHNFSCYTIECFLFDLLSSSVCVCSKQCNNNIADHSSGINGYIYHYFNLEFRFLSSQKKTIFRKP